MVVILDSLMLVYQGSGFGCLSFECNAQIFMNICNYSKRPTYWDIVVGHIYGFHHSSSPKPWQIPRAKKFDGGQDFLGKEDSEKLSQINC